MAENEFVKGDLVEVQSTSLSKRNYGSNSEMVAMIGKEFDVQSSFGNKVTLKGPDSQQNWTFYHEDLKVVSDSENIVSTAMPEMAMFDPKELM